ncbi:hypothetical protein LJD47_28730 [Escherichia coli]|nr:hypothetical protein [Escherichia coli]
MKGGTEFDRRIENDGSREGEKHGGNGPEQNQVHGGQRHRHQKHEDAETAAAKAMLEKVRG